jgi:DNA polymerase
MAATKIDLRKVITLDFETYYDADYTLSGKELNTSAYIRDTRFKVHCVGIKVGEKPAKLYNAKKGEAFLRNIDWNTHTVLAHNTSFDGLILSHHYGIVPSYYACTLSMTRGLHNEVSRAKLDTIAKLYQVGEKSQTYLTPTKGKRELTKGEYDALGAGCLIDVDLCYQVFRKQLEVYPEQELDLIDLTIRMFCDSVLEIDMDKARTALAEEMLERRAIILKSGLSESDLGKNKVFAEKLKSYGIEPPTKISLRTGCESYAFAQTDAEFIELLDHENINVQRLAHGRLAAKSTMAEARAARMLQAGAGGKLPVGYNYWGAKTGRWSGTNKLNLQNLPRVNPKEPKPSDGLRHSITAPKGHSIIVTDSAAIEARVVAWLCGQEDLLDLFRRGEDVYCAMATSIYGRVIDPDKDKVERFVGKVATLGLGYGMGAQKFQTTLAMGAMGPPVELSLAVCKKIVNLYRGKNIRIAQGWKEAQRMLSAMARGQSGTGFNGLLEYDPMTVWLPNGMGLHYPGLHMTEGEQYKYKSFEVWKKIYGGLLVENIVQALARNVVASQMLDTQAFLRSLTLKQHEVARVSMMTHDEIVSVAPTRHADKVLKKQLIIMKTVPTGFDGLPLGAAGGHDTYYSK